MRRATTIGTLVVLLLLPASLAPAQEEAASSESLLLIMDASGSMNRPDDSGVPLIDGAQQALRVLVSALPDGASVGLRVYGHRVPNDDKANGCRDTELVVPVGPLDRGAMTTAIDSFDALGWTPIGLSLQQAAEDLPPVGSHTIVLVSDGVDTCAPPDPCKVAADLVEQGYNIRVHTVGLFLTDAQAEEQLQCIAATTGGRFSRADSVVDLVRDLTGIASEALAGPEQALPVVIGSLERATAPLIGLEQGGDENWDVLGGGALGTIAVGETRWYAVDVPEGRHLHAWATFNHWVLEPGEQDYVEVRIFDESGTEVGVPHAVLEVVADQPQRMYLWEAADWVPFGDPVSVIAVTDPRASFPGWPGQEAEDPYMARMAERLRSEGLNGGLYEMWKGDVSTPALEPGRYYVAATWSGAVPEIGELIVGLTLYEPAERPGDRTRLSPALLADAAPEGAAPLPVALASWDDGPIDAAVPLRAAELWTRIDPGTVQTVSFDLASGEMLEVGWRYGTMYREAEPRIDLSLRGPDGMLRSETWLIDEDTHLAGYDGVPTVWTADATGTWTLELRSSGTWAGADSAAILAVAVFDADAFPSATSTTGAARPEEPPSPEEPPEDSGDGGGDSLLPTILVGGAVVVGGAAGVWWLRRRRTG